MFGAVYGDVIGSYYETHCTKDYDFGFSPDSTFTDDSVLIAAVCRAILENPAEVRRFHLKERAFEYAAQYRQYYSYFPHAGFGNLFSAWAKDKPRGRGHSYGNGASMRVIPIGYAYATLEQTLLQAKASCLPTHDHREAIRGASAVAAAVFLARKGGSKAEIREYIEQNIGYDLSATVEQIRESHVFDSRTPQSVPPAIIAFLQSADYESALRNAVSLGGDADTQACIAGGIAQAFYREIPEHIRRFCDRKIDVTIRSVVSEFEKRYSGNGGDQG